MKQPLRFLIPLAVSAFAIFAALLPGNVVFGEEKDAKAPTTAPAEAKDAAKDVKAKTDEAKDVAKDAPAKTEEPTKDAKAAPEAPAPTTPAPTTPAAPAESLNFKVRPAVDSVSAKLGSLSDAMLEVEISKFGAGIHSVKTSKYRKTVNSDEPYTVLQALWPRDAHGHDDTSQPVWERPFTAWRVQINGEIVNLFNVEWQVLPRPAGDRSLQYRITIVDTADQPVLEITRAYSLGEGEQQGYDITCRTSFRNLSNKPISVIWEQNAFGDVHPEDSLQGGDGRMIVAGYYNLDHDPNKVHVYTDDAKLARSALLDQHAKSGASIWPNEEVDADTEKKNALVWLAMSNRYFTAALHRPIPQLAEGQERTVGLPLDDIFERKIGILTTGEMVNKHDHRLLMFTLTSKPIALAAGESHDLDLCLYAGPRLKNILNSPPFAFLEMGIHLVRYEQGCTFCLFDWLADFLLWFLKLIHAIVFDWGFAIIVLVLVVRLLLHPITKKAQINMTKMSKQMAKLQPELAKLKEKYKNDSAKQQQEMMKLYREAGVNPMGFLGCLPLFLQMPIWVALYAMLYGAIELRHEPAFWGLFQLFGDWQFLRDLSAPDNFIKFGEGSFALPICGLQITHSLNILPILMAAVFYYQQKLTSPPPTNEQMAQQQKMMKWMTLLFPVMFYSAPSGLTLYIMASSLAGIVDSYFVRQHIKREEEAGTLFAKKPPKPGGFFDRMQKMIEAKQKELAEKQAEMKNRRPGDKRKR